MKWDDSKTRPFRPGLPAHKLETQANSLPLWNVARLLPEEGSVRCLAAGRQGRLPHAEREKAKDRVLTWLYQHSSASSTTILTS